MSLVGSNYSFSSARRLKEWLTSTWDLVSPYTPFAAYQEEPSRDDDFDPDMNSPALIRRKFVDAVVRLNARYPFLIDRLRRGLPVQRALEI